MPGLLQICLSNELVNFIVINFIPQHFLEVSPRDAARVVAVNPIKRTQQLVRAVQLAFLQRGGKELEVMDPPRAVLVHAGGSGIGTAAILMAKAIGCTVFTTVGDDEKGRKAAELGADHVINYKTERFEGEVRRLTKRKGVDVVFEHVGADTWNGSLLCLKRGGRLVTCGATSGPSATINLMQLFQQQYRITGSFGCRIENIRQSLDKMAAGMKPVIDSVFPLEDFEKGLARLEGRQVFGKVVVTF